MLGLRRIEIRRPDDGSISKPVVEICSRRLVVCLPTGKQKDYTRLILTVLFA